MHVQVLTESSVDCVSHWYSRCVMEDCIDDTPWLTDTEHKLLDILRASSVYFVRSSTSFCLLHILCRECFQCFNVVFGARKSFRAPASKVLLLHSLKLAVDTLEGMGAHRIFFREGHFFLK